MGVTASSADQICCGEGGELPDVDAEWDQDVVITETELSQAREMPQLTEEFTLRWRVSRSDTGGDLRKRGAYALSHEYEEEELHVTFGGVEIDDGTRLAEADVDDGAALVMKVDTGAADHRRQAQLHAAMEGCILQQSCLCGSSSAQAEGGKQVANVLVMGDANVGKTTLIWRLTGCIEAWAEHLDELEHSDYSDVINGWGLHSGPKNCEVALSRSSTLVTSYWDSSSTREEEEMKSDYIWQRNPGGGGSTSFAYVRREHALGHSKMSSMDVLLVVFTDMSSLYNVPKMIERERRLPRSANAWPVLVCLGSDLHTHFQSVALLREAALIAKRYDTCVVPNVSCVEDDQEGSGRIALQGFLTRLLCARFGLAPPNPDTHNGHATMENGHVVEHAWA